MAHYAKLGVGNVVEQVIVAEQDFIDTQEGTWFQTSYNTRGGKHTLGGTPLRKNFAGIGFKYDSSRDAFIPPKPYNSWTLDEDTCLWEAPVAYPEDGLLYNWNEENQTWDVVELGGPDG
jgi:hypothetical protein